MNKLIFFLLTLLLVSCSSTKKFSVPMTEKMYQVTKKNYLKKYTKKFVNSIPKEDIVIITKDTIIIIYDKFIP